MLPRTIKYIHSKEHSDSYFSLKENVIHLWQSYLNNTNVPTPSDMSGVFMYLYQTQNIHENKEWSTKTIFASLFFKSSYLLQASGPVFIKIPVSVQHCTQSFGKWSVYSALCMIYNLVV